jgi:hypothetical protein
VLRRERNKFGGCRHEYSGSCDVTAVAEILSTRNRAKRTKKSLQLTYSPGKMAVVAGPSLLCHLVHPGYRTAALPAAAFSPAKFNATPVTTSSNSPISHARAPTEDPSHPRNRISSPTNSPSCARSNESRTGMVQPPHEHRRIAARAGFGNHTWADNGVNQQVPGSRAQ